MKLSLARVGSRGHVGDKKCLPSHDGTGTEEGWRCSKRMWIADIEETDLEKKKEKKRKSFAVECDVFVYCQK
jgi:hypothetical protein